MTLRIGTRGSALALIQANWVRGKLLHRVRNCRIEIVPITTAGDRMMHASISEAGGKGIFVKEIEKVLMAGEVDLAVHSMKDLPVELPRGLHLVAITERENPFDVFISRDHTRLENLPSGSTIATGSLRRKVQLLHFRQDLMFKEIRGNVDTRIRKLSQGFADGIVLAAAALKRLKKERKITHYLHPDICLPAVGQGALGVEVRADNISLRRTLSLLNDKEAYLTVSAERSFLRYLGAECRTPASAYGEISGNDILLKGFVASSDGKVMIKEKMLGPRDRAEILGEFLAKKVLDAGGRELLKHFS